MRLGTQTGKTPGDFLFRAADRGRQALAGPLNSKNRLRPRVGEQGGQALRRMRGVERQVGAAGLEDGEQAGHHRERRFGADAGGCAATDDQRCNDGAAFFDDREDDDGGQKRFCTEADKTVARGEGKNDASRSSSDGHKRQRLRTEFIELTNKLSESVGRSEGCPNPPGAEDAEITEPFEELDDEISGDGESSRAVDVRRVGHRQNE